MPQGKTPDTILKAGVSGEILNGDQMAFGPDLAPTRLPDASSRQRSPTGTKYL